MTARGHRIRVSGVLVEDERLLYVAEVVENALLHVTFELGRTGGRPGMPTNELDANPIADVRFVPLDRLPDCGFSARWCELVRSGFPGAPAYVGANGNLGL